LQSEKTGRIYLLTSPSGNRYVGKTENTLERRWTQHKSDAKQGGRNRLHNAIRKYGPDSFTVEEICSEVPAVWLPIVEIAMIDILGTFRNDHDYNMTVGGEGLGYGSDHPCFGKPAKHRGKKTGKPSWNRGKKASPESIERMRLIKVGKKASDETRAKMSAAAKRKTFSAEHKARISAAKQGHAVSKETREKISRTKALRREAAKAA
jgi:group I intron endonuclease